jgi:hypothetical protein
VGLARPVWAEAVQHDRDPHLGRVQRTQAAAEGQELGAGLPQLDVPVEAGRSCCAGCSPARDPPQRAPGLRIPVTRGSTERTGVPVPAVGTPAIGPPRSAGLGLNAAMSWTEKGCRSRCRLRSDDRCWAGIGESWCVGRTQTPGKEDPSCGGSSAVRSRLPGRERTFPVRSVEEVALRTPDVPTSGVLGGRLPGAARLHPHGLAGHLRGAEPRIGVLTWKDAGSR